MQVEKTVFISYRRTNIYTARAVHQFLINRGYDVFLDFESIDAGSFEHIILSQIAARAHFVLILTPSALERCTTPEDWLRREIEYAIDMKRNIIPVMFDEFDFGTVRLQDKLALLAQYNALEVPASYFTEAMERLHTRFLSKPLEMILHPAEAVIRPPVPDSTPEQRKAEEYFEHGLTHYNNSRYDAAIMDFTRSLLLNPVFAEAFYRRGHVYRVKGETSKAIMDWEAAATLDDPRVHLFRSGVHRLKQQFEQALQEATSAIELSPDDPELYKGRGDIYNDMGDYSAAIADYTQAVTLNPTFTNAYNNLGHAHYNLGNYPVAIESYEAALKIDPAHEVVKKNLDIARRALNSR